MSGGAASEPSVGWWVSGRAFCVLRGRGLVARLIGGWSERAARACCHADTQREASAYRAGVVSREEMTDRELGCLAFPADGDTPSELAKLWECECFTRMGVPDTGLGILEGLHVLLSCMYVCTRRHLSQQRPDEDGIICGEDR